MRCILDVTDLHCYQVCKCWIFSFLCSKLRVCQDVQVFAKNAMRRNKPNYTGVCSQDGKEPLTP